MAKPKTPTRVEILTEYLEQARQAPHVVGAHSACAQLVTDALIQRDWADCDHFAHVLRRSLDRHWQGEESRGYARSLLGALTSTAKCRTTSA